ncbi:MAG: cobalamin-dependent protein [Acidobacteriota bacterium]|nr:cobalamin-dependent protein [Acidobacteriota bacterium]
MDDTLQTLREAILAMDEEGALAATQKLLAGGADPQVILQTGLTEAMLELGRRWNCGDAFLPEIVAAADIFGKCSAAVEPALATTSSSDVQHHLVLATVKGDLHDLGKNIVAALVKTVGIKVHDLGKNVPAERIVEAVRDIKPKLVGLSSLLTTTMPEQKRTIDELHAAGLRSEVKILVGGAPVTQAWADEIGADGYAPNAAEAVNVALALIAK